MSSSSPTLDAERQRSGLPTRDLTYVLRGGKAAVEKLERLERLLAADPIFQNDDINYLARADQYKRGISMAGRVEVIAIRNNLNEEDTDLLRLVFSWFTSCSSSTALHTLMFIKNLALLFTDEQQAKWMQLAKEWKMLGCYAQTELGHGSNVRGLETTATYIPATDEFEIHSPTLSSIKWWPGALARTANFGVVYARLILGGKDYGVHNFMVQLRDLETHELQRGVTTGDIGPKIGFNNVDNGYCKFERVRIPREHMGMRFAMVTRDGKYRKNGGVPQEILYFTMLQTRMDFVRLTGVSLAKACTIAVRYSALRQQGYDANQPASEKELSVLDYQTQQYRLLPLVAASYAITLSGNTMDAFKRDLSEQIQQGNLSMLTVGHAMSCGLKVLCSDLACAGLEVARRALGGHGYLQSSGIPVLLGDLVQTVTAEGENFVLSLQTARALTKLVAEFRAGGALPEAMKFIAQIDAPINPFARNAQQWLEPQHYVLAYQQRFLYQLRALKKRISTAKSPLAAIQNFSVDCYRLSMAYSAFVLVASFASSVKSPSALSREQLTNPAVLDVTRLLCHLFALTQLEANAGEFMESGAVVPADMAVVRANIEVLLQQLRPHAVVLVDGFNFSDQVLNTTLGRHDGKPYEALYESVKLDPVNYSSDKVALHQFLEPIRAEYNNKKASNSRL